MAEIQPKVEDEVMNAEDEGHEEEVPGPV